jgi:spermidine synthase
MGFSKRQRLLFFSITALGISSIITQIIVMREFLSVFYGNELIFGIILSNWLFLTGVGAYLGKFFRSKISYLAVMQIIISVLPIVYIAFIRNLRNILFLPGELIGVAQIFLTSFFLLLPYCLASGILLTFASGLFSQDNRVLSVGKVYFIDNIGDISGGLLFSFIFIYFLNAFQSVYFLFAINLLGAILLAFYIRKRVIIGAIIVLFIAVSFAYFFYDLNLLTRQEQYRGQELLFDKDTPFGNLVVTKTGGQINFFENGLTLFTTENVIANEETVHYAMVQAQSPKRVLLISGGAGGTTKEILKYAVDTIDYVELDPKIIELGRMYTDNLLSARIKIVKMDGRLFVRKSSEKYDVVIIDLPDPGTAQVNRFYTLEFFRELKGKLEKNGVVSLSLSSSENYLNIETRKLNSAVYNTLSAVFNNVIIIPGDRNFYVASDGDLSYNISGLIKEKRVETEYVNDYYLSGKLTADRINSIRNSVIPGIRLNKDFSPVSYYYHLLYWMSRFRFNSTIFFVLMLAGLVWFLWRIKPVSFALFTSGFAGASLEVILLIGFQILYGYAYRQIAVIITFFMIGLAVGSFYMNKRLKGMGKNEMVRLEYSIAFYSMALPLIFLGLDKIGNASIFWTSQIVIPIFTMIIAVFVGMEFPLAAKLFYKGKVEETAGALYNADLVGAAFGALLVSSLLIPVMGIFKVSFLIGVLNLISGIILQAKG